MVLVAIAMVSIIAMAALSIDVVTLYLAREEAQRAADAGALAAARFLTISGVTGDPGNSTGAWPTACGLARQVGQAVAKVNMVGGAAATTVNVTFLYNGTISDCTSPGGSAFSVNPQVQVQVIRQNLPTFFSRIWSRGSSSVSAVGTAEAFNSSNSGSFSPTNAVVPVQPRCVKPWIIPNRDPLHDPNCDLACQTFASTTDGSITNKGISLGGGGSTGVIGETFYLVPDCTYGGGSLCSLRDSSARANHPETAHLRGLPNLEYLPGDIDNTSSAVPSCSAGSQPYEQAVAGCDQSTVYQCGVQSSSSPNPTLVDLSENPTRSGHTTDGVTCLIADGHPDGQDTLDSSSYPFQIFPGSRSLTGLSTANPITSSPSIVSVPIYDDVGTPAINPYPAQTPVTIVGFLQVFINSVDQWGTVNVTILNVAGCSNSLPAGTTPVAGTSPVPVRLITPP